MWFKRDFLNNSQLFGSRSAQVKVLRGPRQVGKTSLLERLGTHRLILFDDHSLRARAQENPELFLDQFPGPLILDEATLVPGLFPEIKKRVDISKRQIRRNEKTALLDYWITGSNQTLLANSVQESLAGRAEFFNLNTLSIHEIGSCSISDVLLRGGWPELHAEREKDPVRYLNSLISTFIEKDIGQAAGIEKKAAFTKVLQLLAGQVGELINFSSLAAATGVESTTVQSWTLLLEQNGILKLVQPHMNSLNKRLIKTPKLYFEDVGLAVRFQGWTEFPPLFVSPYFGHLIENLVYSEISRFYSNSLIEPKVSFIRTKEKVEIDFLVELPNKKFVAIEAKNTPRDFSRAQLNELDRLKLHIVDRLVVSPNSAPGFENSKVVTLHELFDQLRDLL